MLRAISTLVAVVAITVAGPTPGTSAEAPESTPGKTPQVTRKAKARRSGNRAVRKPPPKPTSMPGLAPLESETGPPESDVAKLARVRARRQGVEREILKLRRQADSTLRELDSIDLELRLAAHQLDEAEIRFKETRRLLDATIRDVQNTRALLEITRPRVQKSLSALSKLGELSYARLLFSLDDPADVLRGYRYVARIARADGQQIKAFRASLVQLGELEEQLKVRTAENIATREGLNQARAELSSRKAIKQRKLETIAREQELQEGLVEEYQKREAELRGLLGEALEEAPGAPARPPRPSVAPFQADVPLRTFKGRLPWPVRGTLLRKFGMERDARFGTSTIQQGVEIDAFPENSVRAVHAGRVVYADQFVGYGMLVIVDHGNREHTLYGRLGELSVEPGDDVIQGALLGLLPNTRVTGSGLHFEVRIEGKPEDPSDWLKRP